MENPNSQRKLGSAVATGDSTEPDWALGFAAAVAVLFTTMILFLVLSHSYVGGVLDGTSTESVSTTVFPYFGSVVDVETNGGTSIGIQAGPLPILLAAATFIGLAKPWRLGSRSGRSGASF